MCVESVEDWRTPPRCVEKLTPALLTFDFGAADDDNFTHNKVQVIADSLTN
jgi:hypothetical protein